MTATSPTIIAIGNPGAGKSTILNSLAGEFKFKSGISIASGLTYELDMAENDKGRFYDTPGLSDDTLREKAGKAISKALREGGPFKILFFVRTEAGRIVREDITTFKLVLQAAPEIGNKYGIVANMLPIQVAKVLDENPDQAEKFLTKLFASISEEHKCALSSITYILEDESARNEENILIDLTSKSMETLKGERFADFVYGEVPIVNLTPGKANDIQTEDYDKITKLINVMEERMNQDKKFFEEQQKLLRQQLAKAEDEKRELLRRQGEMMAQMMGDMRDERAKARQRYYEAMRENADMIRENAELRANQGGCFPGVSLVMLEGGVKKSMRDLRIGDVIVTVDKATLVSTKVLGFLEKRINQTTKYLSLDLEDDRSLWISSTHTLFIKGGDNNMKSILAMEVSPGDELITESGFSRVKRVTKTSMAGAYVPLTNAGTLLVDGVLVSCYSNADHWLVHMFLAPLRWWPSLLLDTEQSQHMEGIRTYPKMVKNLGYFLGVAQVSKTKEETKSVDIPVWDVSAPRLT